MSNTDINPIISLTATFDNGLTRQLVHILDVENGQVFVRPISFDVQDPAENYHGWITTAENIHGVMAYYANGDVKGFGDPPCVSFHAPIVAQLPQGVTN